jgi:YD repeat-containing protein
MPDIGSVTMVHSDGSTFQVSRPTAGTSTGSGSGSGSGVHPDSGSPVTEFQGPDWTPQLPLGSPSARSDAMAAYDVSSGTDVLFGGEDSSYDPLGDTWEWNGTNWSEESPTTSPSARSDGAVAYDPSLGEVIIFGGYSDSGGTFYNDTWAWNGTNWSELSPSASPPALAYSSMVWDPSLGELVLFGGVNSSWVDQSGTWAFNGTTWTELSPSTSPSARAAFAMAYDSTSGNIVLFGGNNSSGQLDDTWLFNGSTWVAQSPYASPVALSDTSAAYDAALGGVVLFGGVDSSGDWQNQSFFWNNTTDTWELIYDNTIPQSRQDTIMVPAATNGQLMIFGGESYPYLSDTQIYDWGHNGSSTGNSNASFDAGDRNTAQVDLGTGNLYVAHDLWNIANTGLNSSGYAFYNSLSGYWFDSTFANVSVLPNGSVIVNYVSGTNGTLIFTKSGSTYTPPAGSDMTLTYNATAGTYVLTMNQSQLTYTFDATYDGLDSITDRNGNTISVSGSYVADNRGRNVDGAITTSGSNQLTTWTDSGLSRTWVETKPSGGIADSSIADADSNSTGYSYNSAGQMTELTDPDGHEIKFGYDDDGRIDSVTQVTNPSAGTGPTTTYTWQAVPSGTVVPAGETAQYEVVVTDPNGHDTTYIDAYGGQAIKVVDANGNNQTSTYSTNRDPESLVNGLSQTSTLSYDVNNNPTQATEPASGSMQTPVSSYASYATPSTVSGYTYLPSSSTDGEGNCTAQTYDDAGNPTSTYSGLTPTSHECDGETSGTGVVTTTKAYQGDPGVTSCGGKTGELCTSTSGNGYVTDYSYDSEGQLTSVVAPGGSCTGTRKLCTTYTYDADSRVATVTDGKGQTTTYSYDNEDRITRALYDGATSCTYSSGHCITFSYDADGNLVTRHDSTGTTTLVYDDLGRLVKEELPSGANACSGSSPAGIVYGYDAASNLTSYCDAGGTVTYAYDPGNRMVGVATGSGSCTPGSIVQPCSVYAYNYADQLTSITYPTSTGVTETFTPNNAGDITEAAVTGGSTTAGSYSYTYTTGADDKPLVQSAASSASGVTTDYRLFFPAVGVTVGG